MNNLYVNPGSALFDISVHSHVFVDKTQILSVLNRRIRDDSRFVCISRPRRFGKSVTADMLCAYYSKNCDSSALFAPLKIAKDPSYAAHLNRHNVIFLNMQDFYGDAKKDVAVMLSTIDKSVIEELHEVFPDVDLSASKTLKLALEKIFKVKGETFVFVIDEWDCIMRDRRHDAEAFEDYLEYLRELFKGKIFVDLAYMTGILPVKKYGTHSALNMCDEISMIVPAEFAPYIGFTEDEVKSLCEKYQVNFNSMKRWYDGYSYDEAPHIYNPNSVVKAITKKQFLSYWTQTETYEALRRYIDLNFNGLRDDVSRLISGDEIEFNPGKFQNDMVEFASKNDVLALLVHLGYLAVKIKKMPDETTQYYARIPNQEIRGEFINSIEDNVNYAGTWNAIAASQRLLEAIWRQDAEAVAQGIDQAHEENASILKYNDENSLSCVLSNALYHARSYYQVVRELPAGRGFADLVYLPLKNVDKPALLVEVKQNASADSAITQIKEKKYTNFFSDYKGEVLLVGINYFEASKRHECIIEKWDRT